MMPQIDIFKKKFFFDVGRGDPYDIKKKILSKTYQNMFAGRVNYADFKFKKNKRLSDTL